MKQSEFLTETVFPSGIQSIKVFTDDIYGGAHLYSVTNSLGFSNGKADYHDSSQVIQFVKKEEDGTMTPGVQSEQLAIILMDRARKLNAVYPSEQNLKMIIGLKIFLDACKERITDRIERGVMGDLKK